MSRICKSNGTEGSRLASSGLVRVEQGATAHVCGVSLGSTENVLELDKGDGVQHHGRAKSHWNVRLKVFEFKVNYILYKFYLNLKKYVFWEPSPGKIW